MADTADKLIAQTTAFLNGTGTYAPMTLTEFIRELLNALAQEQETSQELRAQLAEANKWMNTARAALHAGDER